MEETLQTFLVTGVFAFILTFVRIGTALMIMPGLGDSFIPQNIRLMMAFGLSLVLAPLVQPFIPNPVPTTMMLFVLITAEFVIGLFFGTIARILMAALDTAGMVISLSSGLANAQLFNPSLATQGSLVGAFLSVTGTLLIFVTNLHHLLIYGLVESYQFFPVGDIPQAGSMAELVSRAVATSFLIGVQMAAPFFILSILIYVGMGVLSRLMPQVQVFLLALPAQILLAMVTLTLTVSGLFLFWLSRFEDGMMFFLSQP